MADADGDSSDTISREFCVNIKEDERLNLTWWVKKKKKKKTIRSSINMDDLASLTNQKI